MKDVDPNGFVERRPKSKAVTIGGLPDASGKAPLSLPGPSASSTSLQRRAHVTVPPLTMDQSTDPSVGMAAQPMSRSLPYSNAHLVLNMQPLEFAVFPPEGLAAGNLCLPTRVSPEADLGIMGNGVGDDSSMDCGSAPSLNSRTRGTADPIAVERHARDDVVTIHSSLTSLHEDAPCPDNQEIDQVQQSHSGNAGTTHMALGSPTAVLAPTQPGPPDTINVSTGAADASENPCKPFNCSLSPRILTFVVDSASDEATISSRATGGLDRHFCVLLHLGNTLTDLWSRLDDWCAAPLGHTDTELPRPVQFLNSHARGTSVDTVRRCPQEATRTGCVLEV